MSDTDNAVPQGTEQPREKSLEELRGENARLKEKIGKLEPALQEREQLLAELQTDPYFNAGLAAYQKQIDPVKLVQAIETLASGTAEQQANAAKIIEAQKANPNTDPALVQRLERLEQRLNNEVVPRVAEAQQFTLNQRLESEAKRFCDEYGVTPGSEQAIRIRDAAAAIANKDEPIGYVRFAQVAGIMGLKPKNSTSVPDSSGQQTHDGPPPIERGGSSPVPAPSVDDDLKRINVTAPGGTKRLWQLARERQAAKGR